MGLISNTSDKLTWGVTLAGPYSWILVFAAAWLVSQKTDGGWIGMAVMFTGMAVILLIHILSPIILMAQAIARRRADTPIGKAIIMGLCYYGLVATIVLTVEEPREFTNDSITLLKALLGF